MNNFVNVYCMTKITVRKKSIDFQAKPATVLHKQLLLLMLLLVLLLMQMLV